MRTELIHDGSDVHLTMVQLPAVNTPQFGWCRTRLPNHPKPVPPIYQPEVAAKAILWSAENRRRELMVGGSTLKAVLGNRLAPGLADRYLARTGYEAQQVAEPVRDDRAENLFRAVDEDRGARGRFGEESRSRSLHLWATTNRRRIGAATGAVGVGALAAGISKSRRWLDRR